ncbi:MAG: DNA-directed RNA polymerase subunit beta [bacterium]|nr:DNA-directed RNA polymerase subunit beta [bacterium]
MSKSTSSSAKAKPFRLSTVEDLEGAHKQALALATAADENNRQYFTSKDDYPFPNLIEVQLDSYEWFLNEGIKELFDEISPIVDFSGKKIELHFMAHSFEDPKYAPEVAKRRNLSYESSLKVHVRLVNKESGEIKEQDIYLGNIPLMTDRGTFIVNGIERVVVNQLVRSPGVFFARNPSHPHHFTAKIIPKRGVWLELETDKKGVIHVKIDRRRKVYLTSLLRIFGYETDKEILNLFSDLRKEGQADYILNTLEKDHAKTSEDAYQAIYRKLRPGDMATAANAKQLIDSMFFDFKRYDMSVIARYKMNKRFGTKIPHDSKHRVFQVEDMINISRQLFKLNSGHGVPDDIDHLSNRRVRSVGELVQNKFRIGLLRTERIAKDRMTVIDLDTVTPTQLINARPITAVMREFFASSQLSQFMDQTNPLSELAHKRRLSAMGPGGLSRERASFDVRDVHTSHYGRICPIATPEGPNIGLVVHLATYARVNEYGFIETPLQTVLQTLPKKTTELEGWLLSKDILDEDGKVLYKKDEMIDKKMASALIKLKHYEEIPVRAHQISEVKYYDADDEREFIIAQSNTEVDKKGQIVPKQVSARKNGEPVTAHVNDISHMDISPKQIISVSTSLIPFLEHDDNTRASMGTNMQRQAVSLVRPSAPIVGTGMEGLAARSSGHVVVAERDGIVESVDASRIAVLYKNGEKKSYDLSTYQRSNQATCIHMRPTVSVGDKVKKGQVLSDGAAIRNGELALGQNLMVAYMSWEGYNFEDAVIISDRIFRKGLYDSVHIEAFTTDVRDTKLGPEVVTRDIPNVGEEKLKDLDSEGVVRIGAFLKEGDILVGKITPKGETDLSPEERLLQAIFGDKAKDVKDTSLRLPGGSGGKVVDIQIFSRADGDELPQGVIKQIKVYVAQTRKVQVGDKMAGRHGNKGVISRIVPEEDMPYMPDGTAVDIILNPLGVSSRMNIGQILETHLGWAADILGITVATPVLNGIPNTKIVELLKLAGLPEDGKVQLYDGKSGQPFDHRTTVGMVYMLKLLHLVEDKIHARSVGPYSLVTQQPLGGKAQHGGQRFGEMEVWALEAYGAAHALQEMLTIKSDDIYGRSRAYESIVKHEAIRKPSTPESFNVLVRELQSLGLAVDLLDTASGDHLAVEEVIETEQGDADIITRASRDKVQEMEGGEIGVVEEGIHSSTSLDEMSDEEEELESKSSKLSAED